MATIKNIGIFFDDNTMSHIKYDEEEKTFNFIINNVVIFKAESLGEALRKIELIYK